MSSERRITSTITFVRLIQTPRGTHPLRGRIEMAVLERPRDHAPEAGAAEGAPACLETADQRRPLDETAA